MQRFDPPIDPTTFKRGNRETASPVVYQRPRDVLFTVRHLLQKSAELVLARVVLLLQVGVPELQTDHRTQTQHSEQTGCENRRDDEPRRA